MLNTKKITLVKETNRNGKSSIFKRQAKPVQNLWTQSLKLVCLLYREKP